ncbi:MAG: hypothetical protein DLM70_16580 [Chloroflexi bacterium]|nr:MAG: hypothetical protein DLM70_16580 [Chloroflexota bacterium]
MLFGAGTPDRAGKTIIIKRAPLVCKSLGGFGIRLVTPRSTGLLPPLHWKNGTLYYRDHTSGRCVGVASPALAAAPGMYQVVPGTGVTSMPKTGGGDPVRQPFAPAAPAIFSLLVLLAGGVRLARAR